MTPNELPPSFRGSSLEGKVAVVTGSTQGLGEATVRLFKERGCRGLVITGRNEERGKRIANELTSDSCEAIFVRANLENLDEVRRILSVTEVTFGTIDVLVNAAATIDRVSILDTTPEDYDRIMNVNVRAPFFLIQGAAKIMEREKVAGAIVNLSSTASYGSMPMLPAFGMSKGALNVATKNASHSLMWSKIRVNALAIGWSLLKPDEVAHCIAFCASDESGMMTGCVIDFDQSVLGAGNVPVPQRKDQFDTMHNVTIAFNSKHRYGGATPSSQDTAEPPAPEAVSKASATSPKTKPVPVPQEDPNSLESTTTEPSFSSESTHVKPESLVKAEKSITNRRRPKSPHPQRPLPKPESRLVPELDTQSENRRLLLIKQSSSKRWPPMAPLSKQISNSKLLMSTELSASNHPPRAPLTKQISKSKLLMSDRELALITPKSTRSHDDSEEEGLQGETATENNKNKSPKSTELPASNIPHRAPLTKQISKSKLLMSDRELALLTPKSTRSHDDSEEEASSGEIANEKSKNTSPKAKEFPASNRSPRRFSRDSSPSPPKRLPSIPAPPPPNASDESSPDEDHPDPKEFRPRRNVQEAGEQTRPDDYLPLNDPDAGAGAPRKKERAKRRNSSEKIPASPKALSKSPPKPPKSPKQRLSKSPKARPPRSPKARAKKPNYDSVEETLRQVRKMQDAGENTRPDDFLPSADPYAAAKIKKKHDERSKRKNSMGLSDSSSDHRAAKVDEWMGGSGKAQRRSWKVKNVREIQADA